MGSGGCFEQKTHTHTQNGTQTLLIALALQEASDLRKYTTFLEQRPKRFEAAAIDALIGKLRVAAATGSPAAPGFGLHIAHLGNAEALGAVAAAKAEGTQ